MGLAGRKRSRDTASAQAQAQESKRPRFSLLNFLPWSSGLGSVRLQTPPSPEPAPETREAVDRLRDIRRRCEALLHGGWAMEARDRVFDELMLPTMVAAENSRVPDLRLAWTADLGEFAQWLRDEDFPPGGKRALLPLAEHEHHIVVADARRHDDQISVLVIDPLAPTDARSGLAGHEVLPAFQSALPDNVVLTLLMLGAQKDSAGCRIFALSTASKLAKQNRMIDMLHQQNLSGQPWKNALGTQARQLAGIERMRMFDGKEILTPEFMKHSQSRTALESWLQSNPRAYAEASVNKKGQTLLSRYDERQIDQHRQPSREARPAPEGPGTSAESIRTSNSINHKRLAYIDHAIEYLLKAPAEQSAEFLFLLRWKTEQGLEIDNLEPDQREWGPKPDRPSPDQGPAPQGGQ